MFLKFLKSVNRSGLFVFLSLVVLLVTTLYSVYPTVPNLLVNNTTNVFLCSLVTDTGFIFLLVIAEFITNFLSIIATYNSYNYFNIFFNNSIVEIWLFLNLETLLLMHVCDFVEFSFILIFGFADSLTWIIFDINTWYITSVLHSQCEVFILCICYQFLHSMDFLDMFIKFVSIFNDVALVYINYSFITYDCNMVTLRILMSALLYMCDCVFYHQTVNCLVLVQNFFSENPCILSFVSSELQIILQIFNTYTCNIFDLPYLDTRYCYTNITNQTITLLDNCPTLIDFYNLVLNHYTTYEVSKAILSIILCLKCLFIFLLIVLVRVTVPRFKLETISKLGWFYSLMFLVLIFSFYMLGHILF